MVAPYASIAATADSIGGRVSGQTPRAAPRAQRTVMSAEY